MLDFVLALYHAVSHLMLTWILRGWHYDYLHFTHEEEGTEGLRISLTLARGADLGFKAKTDIEDTWILPSRTLESPEQAKTYLNANIRKSDQCPTDIQSREGFLSPEKARLCRRQLLHRIWKDECDQNTRGEASHFCLKNIPEGRWAKEA